MRLLVFSCFYPPYVGGVENIARAAVEGLAARGHDVTVLTSGDVPPGEAAVQRTPAGARVVRMAWAHPRRDEGWALREAERLVPRLLDSGGFDLVHAHLLTYPWTPDRSRWLLRELAARELPVVDQAHGGTPERDASLCLELMAQVRGLIADSHAAERQLRMLLPPTGDGPPLPPVEVVYPAIVPLDRFRPNPETRQVTRAHLGLQPDDYVVFYPSRFFDIDGSLSVRKRPLLALDAFARLARRYPRQARLLAVRPPGFTTPEGEREARDEVDARVRELGVDGRVVFVDRRVEHERMAELFNASDVTLVPSEEGFGLVYLESLASGVPVVGIAAGASLEVVSGGGILVDPAGSLADSLADALMQMGDRELRAAACTEARSVAESRFAPSDWVQRMERVLVRHATQWNPGSTNA